MKSSTTGNCNVCTGAGRLPCSKCNGAVAGSSADQTASLYNRMAYARRARSHIDLNADARSTKLVVGPPLSEEQKRMADVVRKRVKHVAGSINASDDELIGAPSSSKGRFSKAGSVRSVMGRLDDVGGADSVSVLPPRDRDVVSSDVLPCARCMGTGYLTCMACNH